MLILIEIKLCQIYQILQKKEVSNNYLTSLIE